MKQNLLEFDAAGLTAWIAALGEKPFRAKQVLRWLHQFGEDDFERMTDVARRLRVRLAELAEVRLPQMRRDSCAADGTRKWLLDVGGGNAVECVFIPEGDREGLSKGPASGTSEREAGVPPPLANIPYACRSPFGGAPSRTPGRYRGTLCISTQAGCALDCAFCSTGRQGFNRNLTAGEIIGQLRWAKRALGDFRGGGNHRPAQTDFSADRLISNVVLMGMGEPLANFENVVTALRLMLDDNAYGLSRRRVTVSTAGIVPAIDRLREECAVALAVSLHAPNDALRDRLVPINRKYPLAVLLAACRRYLEKSPRDFITFEYVMLDGINDSEDHARQLVRLVRDVPCKFNLIPFNSFPHSGFRRSPAQRVRRFAEILMQSHIVTTTRRPRGEDIAAACGQLAGQVHDRTQRKAKRAITIAEATS